MVEKEPGLVTHYLSNGAVSTRYPTMLPSCQYYSLAAAYGQVGIGRIDCVECIARCSTNTTFATTEELLAHERNLYASWNKEAK